MKCKLLIGVLLSILIILTGCTTAYTDGSCGSLCVQNECQKSGNIVKSVCGYTLLGELVTIDENIYNSCFNKCYGDE